MASEINYFSVSSVIILKEPSTLKLMVYNPQKSYSDGSATGIQFSILGPVLFLIYMNDVMSASEYFTFTLYADDTTLFSTMLYSLSALPNEHTALPNEHNVLINGEYLKVNDSHVSIRLYLNTNKTKYMIFRSSKQNTSVTFPST